MTLWPRTVQYHRLMGYHALRKPSTKLRYYVRRFPNKSNKPGIECVMNTTALLRRAAGSYSILCFVYAWSTGSAMQPGYVQRSMHDGIEYYCRCAQPTQSRSWSSGFACLSLAGSTRKEVCTTSYYIQFRKVCFLTSIPRRQSSWPTAMAASGDMFSKNPWTQKRAPWQIKCHRDNST